jgi:tRNA(Arg) A34 adenosine deaminase TadA
MKRAAGRSSLTDSWNALPKGARISLEEQWTALAAGGLPCGSAIVDSGGEVLSKGRNHSYDKALDIRTRRYDPLQHNRLAHAELNALALIPTETDHAPLTLWTTQHPCSMCAAAIRFVGIRSVYFIADDPSDHSSKEERLATRAGVPYEALGDPLWWTISNLLFLYNSAAQRGRQAGNLRMNRDRYPRLVQLALNLAVHDDLGKRASSGVSLVSALEFHFEKISETAKSAPRFIDAGSS